MGDLPKFTTLDLSSGTGRNNWEVEEFIESVFEQAGDNCGVKQCANNIVSRISAYIRSSACNSRSGSAGSSETAADRREGLDGADGGRPSGSAEVHAD
jgi:hypothetical protein